MAGYMNFTLSRAPNENWVDEGGPDCFYRSNCQELFYESFCFRFYRSNLKKGFTKASFPAIQIFFQRVPWPRREFHTCTLVIIGKNLFFIFYNLLSKSKSNKQAHFCAETSLCHCLWTFCVRRLQDDRLWSPWYTGVAWHQGWKHICRLTKSSNNFQLKWHQTNFNICNVTPHPD